MNLSSDNTIELNRNKQQEKKSQILVELEEAREKLAKHKEEARIRQLFRDKELKILKARKAELEEIKKQNNNV